MALHKPLVFDSGRGVPRALESADVLYLPGDLLVDGFVGFYGNTPAPKQPVGGDWAVTLDQLVNGLALLGLISDERSSGWDSGLAGLGDLTAIGSYEPGRLIIGSTTGWTQLDQPAMVPGVIQVPTAHAGLREINPANGLPVQTLAYSPILSYGAKSPPTTPQVASLWFDTANHELKIFTGIEWEPVASEQLQQLTAVIAAAERGSLLMANGSGGIEALVPGPGGPGRVLMLDDTQQGHYVNLVTVATSAPWADGASAFGSLPNGGRPAGVDQAIWCNPATNAETIGFWDEAAHRWKTAYVGNPVLNQLAELRGAIANGDLFTVTDNKVVALPIGVPGDSLTVDNGQPVWRARVTQGQTPPSCALDGDLWLDESSGALYIRVGEEWIDLNKLDRYTLLNGTGGAVEPGTVLMASPPNWLLAGPPTPTGSVIAIALESVCPGAQLAAAIGGVVSLTAAQWSAVIDNAEPHAPGTGLSPGRDYYVSSLALGQMTTKPTGCYGVQVGTALSSTDLLLRDGPMAKALINTRAFVGPAAPPGCSGELWWSDETSQLSVYSGETAQWNPVVPGPIEPPITGPTGVVVRDLEAIDWIPDPLAAAIQIVYSDGTLGTLRFRGAGGAVVTMSDSQTLVIDAGSSSGGSGGGGGEGLPDGADEDDVLTWINGEAVWNPPPAPVTISPQAPASAVPGDLWWCNLDGRLYVLYDDGTSVQWVAATPQGSGAQIIDDGFYTGEAF